METSVKNCLTFRSYFRKYNVKILPAILRRNNSKMFYPDSSLIFYTCIWTITETTLHLQERQFPEERLRFFF